MAASDSGELTPLFADVPDDLKAYFQMSASENAPVPASSRTAILIHGTAPQVFQIKDPQRKVTSALAIVMRTAIVKNPARRPTGTSLNETKDVMDRKLGQICGILLLDFARV